MSSNPAPESKLPLKRKYNNKSRQAKQEELKMRIAAATAELHAIKGAAETSYADIARQAGVSLPTVYSHFPDEDALFRGCTSHAAKGAPDFPMNKILEAADLSPAIELLVEAMEAQHLYYEPWSARRIEGYISFVAELSDQIRKQQTEMIAAILSHFLGPGKRRSMIAECETLLSFDSWHRLARGHRLPLREVRQIMTRGLLSAIETTPIPGSSSKSGSNSKSRRQLP